MPPTATMPPPSRPAHHAWDTMPFEEVQRDLAGCIERVHATHAPIVITKGGCEASVIADATDVAGFLDYLEIREAVRIGDEQVARGEVIPHEQVMLEIDEMLESFSSKP